MDHCRAVVIAGEEFGEVCEATLDHTRRVADPVLTRVHLREEWVQLAAVAIRAIEDLDKEQL